MQQLSSFQIIVLGIFGAFVLVGVGVFAVAGGLGGGSDVGAVEVWGTMDSSVIQNFLGTLRPEDKTFQNVSYTQKQPATYEGELINAMASGSGPDLFMLSQEQLVTFADKVLIIPYRAVSQGAFVTTYVDEGQLFLTAEGSYGLPFVVDPLVMYWNRDLFASAGVASPPRYWNDFFDIAPKITSLDAGAAVRKSAVALGEWQNVLHAKDILAALFIQAGDPIVARDTEGTVRAMLGTRPANLQSIPAESALRFYTEFANPSKTSYSWNKALPRSDNAFTSGDLAVYFGYASEYPTFSARNPNLRFGVELLPQIEGSASSVTYGRLIALAVPRTSSNPTGALTVAERLTGARAVGLLSSLTGLPPVRRDVALDTSDNAALAVFVQSALIAHGWLDPAPTITNGLFQSMIESVISGKEEPAGAVAGAGQELSQLLRQ